MTAREEILTRIRTNLGEVEHRPLPAPRLTIPKMDQETRIAMLLERAAALTVKTHRTTSPSEYVARVTAGKTTVASNSPFLRECGITGLADVRSADYGITSADYALADTGTLVMFSSHAEARLISLLPPAHIAIVPAERILSGLDELLTLIPKPSDVSSSLVLITGPSRTGDIEQILVRGVHGPGEVHLVVVG